MLSTDEAAALATPAFLAASAEATKPNGKLFSLKPVAVGNITTDHQRPLRCAVATRIRAVIAAAATDIAAALLAVCCLLFPASAKCAAGCTSDPSNASNVRIFSSPSGSSKTEASSFLS